MNTPHSSTGQTQAGSATADPVIRLENVYKIFGRSPKTGVTRLQAGESHEALRDDGLTPAVIDATLDVKPGELYVVMGLSGSGKSTLIRMVNGLLAPTAGRVFIGDDDISAVSPKDLRRIRQERVSMVFQHFALLPHRTVGENVAFGLEIRGLNRSDREDKANEALDLVGLGGWGDSLPDELSGGMRQRVGIARALASGTDIMLMDEAFSALDPLIRREMQDQLIDLQSRLGRTILFITHDLNEAMRLGDRIAMMRDGRIVQIGTAEQILTDPANDYVAQFVQDVDRTRILTASTVMERPAAVLGSELGPRAAHRLIRENQLNALFVVDRSGTLMGYVTEADVANAVRAGTEGVRSFLLDDMTTVHADTVVADLLSDVAQSPIPVPVLDDRGRLLGVIPRVTLLNALDRGSGDAESGNGSNNGDGPSHGQGTDQYPAITVTGAEGVPS